MLIANFYPCVGGTEKQCLEISMSLVSRGIKVTILTRKFENALKEENLSGILVRRLATFGAGFINAISFMILSFLYLWKHSKEYDVIHVHLASSPALVAMAAGKLFGKRVLIKLGGGRGVDEITLSQKTLQGRIKLKLFSIFKPKLLVMNKDVLDWLKTTEFSCLGLEQFKNGVDTGKYSQLMYSEKINAKRKLGFENVLTFLFVGRLSPEKRIREFIEIWEELTHEEGISKKVHLVIVGKGPQEQDIKNAIGVLNLAGTVTMTGEKMDLLPYYHACDIFILPSVSEGLSNSMLEAMSCGLAVIASKVGGAREAIVEEKNGFLFDPLNRTEIKNCIKRFLTDPGLAIRMGEKSREIAVHNYSMSKVTEELMKTYSQT